jgi:hypothetical protein
MPPLDPNVLARAGIPINPASQPPPLGQQIQGQAQAQQQPPLNIGPPRDEAHLQQRQSQWEEFFSRPEVAAGLLQFASILSGPNQHQGQSTLNKSINAIGGGFQAAGRVQTAQAAQQAAARAEGREDTRLALEVDAPIRESREKGLDRAQETRERREGEVAARTLQRDELGSKEKINQSLAELQRAQAKEALGKGARSTADNAAKIRVAEINAQGSIDAALARKGPIPTTIEEYVPLAQQELYIAALPSGSAGTVINFGDDGSPLGSSDPDAGNVALNQALWEQAGRQAEEAAARRFPDQAAAAKQNKFAALWEAMSAVEAEKIINNDIKRRNAAQALGMTEEELIDSFRKKKSGRLRFPNEDGGAGPRQ